jgi:hypothetical protein
MKLRLPHNTPQNNAATAARFIVITNDTSL